MFYFCQNGIDTYLPREGTETVLGISIFSVGIATYLPREGMETLCPNKSSLIFWFQYRYLSTSRGGGNLSLSPVDCMSSICVSTYLPRKGPET